MVWFGFHGLPAEEANEGGAERELDRDQPLRLSCTHAHTPPSVQMRSFSEVEVYIEHLGEVRGHRSFPPLHKDLCPLRRLLPTPTSALIQPPSFMFPSFFLFGPRPTADAKQFPSCAHAPLLSAPRHRAPSEMNEEGGDKLSNCARLYLGLIGHHQTTGFSGWFRCETALRPLCSDIDEKIMSLILAVEMRK